MGMVREYAWGFQMESYLESRLGLVDYTDIKWMPIGIINSMRTNLFFLPLGIYDCCQSAHY
jgi:hypothetical protein